jgi:membrane fusion protein, copper/silver efflux system
MKKIVGAAAVALLMILSYALGRRHAIRSAADTPSARRALYWVDPMHPDYKSDRPGTAPDCGMSLQPVYAEDLVNAGRPAAVTGLSAGAVAINSELQQTLNIRVATVHRSAAPQFLRALGRVVPEDTLVYRVDAGTDGFIRETFNDSVGGLVKKDQTLATCYGPEYLSVGSGFLAAAAGIPGANGRDGSRPMAFPGAVAKQGVSSLQGYTDRLRNLGMSEVQINRMAQTRQLPESVDIVSPAEGFIVSRNITAGQHFDRSTEFYRIADLSRVWIEAEVFGREAEEVRPGAIARVTSPGQGKTFTARVTKILPQIDSDTRTFKLRLEANNPDFSLRPDMFVDIELPVSMPRGLTVPAGAVIDSGREQRVFVERANGVFEPRTVRTGWHFGDSVEVVQGLTEGERVVAEGTFLVDSESRLKSYAEEAAESRGPAKSSSSPSIQTSAGTNAHRTMISSSAAVSAGSAMRGQAHCSMDSERKCDDAEQHSLALNKHGQQP